AGARDRRIVEGSDGLERPEGRFHALRLAAGTAEVGLDRVAEAAVGDLVAAQHAAHRFGRTAAEPVRELEPVDEAGVEEHVSFGRGERRFGERLHMWFLRSGRAMTVPGGTDARPVL